MIITPDRDRAEKEPALLKKVAQAHGEMAGVDGAVLVQGMLHKGDPVELLDSYCDCEIRASLFQALRRLESRRSLTAR